MFTVWVKWVYRKFFFFFKKIYISSNKRVQFDIGAYADRKTLFEGHNYLGMDVFLSETYVGYGSYISDFSKLFQTYIGKYTSIGQNVTTAIGKHPISENISTCPSFFSLNPKNRLRYVAEQYYEEIAVQNDSIYSIIIGNDVWIGNNVTILQGVTIGDGAIVGAGAVVTKNIEPYAVCVGNPARVVKYRFSKDEIQKLLKLQWWNRNIEWIKGHADGFKDPQQFFQEDME